MLNIKSHYLHNSPHMDSFKYCFLNCCLITISIINITTDKTISINAVILVVGTMILILEKLDKVFSNIKENTNNVIEIIKIINVLNISIFSIIFVLYEPSIICLYSFLFNNLFVEILNNSHIL